MNEADWNNAPNATDMLQHVANMQARESFAYWLVHAAVEFGIFYLILAVATLLILLNCLLIACKPEKKLLTLCIKS